MEVLCLKYRDKYFALDQEHYFLYLDNQKTSIIRKVATTKTPKNVSLLLIAIMIFVVNIWDGDLYRALIRFVILLVASIIISYKFDR